MANDGLVLPVLGVVVIMLLFGSLKSSWISARRVYDCTVPQRLIRIWLSMQEVEAMRQKRATALIQLFVAAAIIPYLFSILIPSFKQDNFRDTKEVLNLSGMSVNFRSATKDLLRSM